MHGKSDESLLMELAMLRFRYGRDFAMVVMRAARALSRASCQHHANMSSENLQFWNMTPEKVVLYSCFSGAPLLKIGSAAPVLQISFLYSIGFACSHFLQMIYQSAGIFYAFSRWNIHAMRQQAREFPNLYIVHCTLYFVHPYPSVESPRREVMRLMART